MSLSPSADRDLASLMEAVRANDNGAWADLTRRFERMMRSVARSYRLNEADVDDVLQTVWLRLHEHIDRLRNPSAVAGWLATTTRRESLRLLQMRTREQLTDDAELLESVDLDRPDAKLLAAERNDVLQRALETLPAHQRRLMVLLVTAPADYRQISATLDIPIGSIGPTRARSLTRLGRHRELCELHRAAG
jgi:RNA polymerase sigma factor (sigma-70 family)